MTEADAERAGRDPFDGERIEIAESEMQTANRHPVWLGRFKHKLEEMATRLTYGRQWHGEHRPTSV